MRNDGKVINLTSRLEKWYTAYEIDNMVVSVSNHGRTHIKIDSKEITLEMMDSVDLLGRVSESFERHNKL